MYLFDTCSVQVHIDCREVVQVGFMLVVQVGTWLMHLFMVQVDYKLRYKFMHG